MDRVILDRYIGFSFFRIDDIFKIKLIILVSSYELDIIIINISKNLYNLELQRNK